MDSCCCFLLLFVVVIVVLVVVDSRDVMALDPLCNALLACEGVVGVVVVGVVLGG